MKLGVLGYIENNGKILMLYRNKKKNDMHEGFWVAPGGHIENNETPYQALKREIKEETGLNVKKASLKAILTFPEDGDSPFGDLWYGFIFIVKEYSGTITECEEGELSWVEKSEIINLPMWEGDKIFTPLVLEHSNQIYDIMLKYSNGKLVNHNIDKI